MVYDYYDNNGIRNMFRFEISYDDNKAYDYFNDILATESKVYTGNMDEDEFQDNDNENFFERNQYGQREKDYCDNDEY